MVRLHHQLNGHEFEQTLGDSGGAWHAVVHGVTRVGHDLVTEQQKWLLWQSWALLLYREILTTEYFKSCQFCLSIKYHGLPWWLRW